MFGIQKSVGPRPVQGSSQPANPSAGINFLTRGGSSFSARTPFNRSPTPVLPPAPETAREDTSQPEPDPQPELDYATGPFGSSPSPNQAGTGWDQEQVAYDEANQNGDSKLENFEQIDDGFDYSGAEVSGLLVDEEASWMASVGKHGLSGMDDDDREPTAKRVHYQVSNARLTSNPSLMWLLIVGWCLDILAIRE